jgi:DNA-binding FadR family transcriptional regulator
MIEIIQGKGMYVTSSAAEAFEEVMLIALKKMHASPADVDAALRMLLPGACSEAAGTGNDNGIGDVEKLVKAYIRLKDEQADEERLSTAYLKVLSALFASSSNKVLNLLGPALLRLTGGKINAESRDEFLISLSKILQPGDSVETRSELRGFLAQAAEIRREET